MRGPPLRSCHQLEEPTEFVSRLTQASNFRGQVILSHTHFHPQWLEVDFFEETMRVPIKYQEFLQMFLYLKRGGLKWNKHQNPQFCFTKKGLPRPKDGKNQVVSQHFVPTRSIAFPWHLLPCHIQWAGRHCHDANAQLSRARRRHLWHQDHGFMHRMHAQYQ